MIDFKSFVVEVFHPRIRLIRARVRAGKIQRRVKVSGVKNYSLRNGRLVRMTSMEIIHRRQGARRAKVKRRAKMARILMKRARSMRRRQGLGLR